MEYSLLFFQSQFAKIMSHEQYQKQYSYNIRHMYGKKGKRVSYTPYNCTRIIMVLSNLESVILNIYLAKHVVKLDSFIL